MTHSSDTKRHPRRWLATLSALVTIGVAVLTIAIVTTPGGSKNVDLRAARHAPAAVHVAKKPLMRALPPAPAPSAKPKSAIPQNNSGDGDPDNNGGPDDGDGNI